MAKTIPSILKNLIHPDLHWKMDLLKHWPAIVGDIARHAHIEKVYQDTIIIGVHDACWLQELHMISNDILHTLNKYLKTPYIKHIRFKQAVVKKTFHYYKKTNRSVTQTKPTTLSIEQNEALRNINDKELAQALKEFWYRCVQEKYEKNNT